MMMMMMMILEKQKVFSLDKYMSFMSAYPPKPTITYNFNINITV